MRVLSLFSGIGGLELGLERAGMTVVGQCEIDPFCRRVLAKHWPGVWRWDDVRTLTGDIVREHCGPIDLICGGFPCQGISSAGSGGGIDGDERSGLWAEFYRLICELRPSYAIVENSAMLTSRGLGRVVGDLADIGYDAEWDSFSAAVLGAPHERERLFIVSYPNAKHGYSRLGVLSDHEEALRQAHHRNRASVWMEAECPPPGIPDGSAAWVDRRERTEVIGNAVVPQVAEFIGRMIMESQHV